MVMHRRLLLLGDREVQSHPNDDAHKQHIQETDDQQRLLDHQHSRETVLEIEVVNVILDQIAFGKLNDGSAKGVQIGVVQRIRQSLNRIGSDQLQVGTAFGEDDANEHFVDVHIIVDVIDQTHFQKEVLVGVEKVLKARHIVAERVVGAPSTE